ncbi:hypothetical protein FA95DRAFT_1612143 [Auriscalpium vulgare]|uniref:Uncharacterized protein n=1 Tax=Auriscalpium vulgare TaxID=40419 RepID=A0ACB8R7A7_9AGAM|nr:hypothetical protein FA95DRAFT_1612143 [Auriscalpium vulgare]
MSLPAASATADNLDLLSLLTQAPFAGFDVGDADREVALRLWADKVNQLVTLFSIRASRSLRDLAFHFTSPILEFMVKLVPASAPIAQRFEGTLMRTTPDATRASPRWSQMFSPFPVDATDAQLHMLISIVEAGLWTVYYFGDGSVESYLQEITKLHNAFPRLHPQGINAARLAHISSAQAIAEIPTGFNALVHPSDRPGPIPVPADPVVAVPAALPVSAPNTAEVPPSVASSEEVEEGEVIELLMDHGC